MQNDTVEVNKSDTCHCAGGKRRGSWECKFSATPRAGVSKYGHQEAGQFSFQGLNLPENVRHDLEEAASHSLAKGTWSSYKTAERLLAMYCSENKVQFILPVSDSVLLGFIHWLVYKRGVKAGTVSSYLAGIRKLYAMKNIPEPNLRSEQVQMVLKGRQNMESADRLRGHKQQRQPVTPDILLLFKNRLIHWESNNLDKVTIWLVATLLFHGAFRGGELLCKTADQFDPAFTLLRKDLVLVKGQGQCSVQVRLKAPKEDKDAKANIVDVYQSNTDICPVKAYAKWEKATRMDSPEQPAFRLQSGVPLTPRKFNDILKERLAGYIGDQKIQAHSFRSGAASMMGSLGYSDKDVKAVGRWSSRAFEAYIKLPRTKRIAVASKLNKHGFGAT